MGVAFGDLLPHRQHKSPSLFMVLVVLLIVLGLDHFLGDRAGAAGGVSADGTSPWYSTRSTPLLWSAGLSRLGSLASKLSPARLAPIEMGLAYSPLHFPFKKPFLYPRRRVRSCPSLSLLKQSWHCCLTLA
ncbi:hypothetical protein DM01DRAFT_1406328 [Hesseltinella vesiculosa]|uniref:Uncharacterized protein n=1 Tax=Hesseltinella vesiculosa TaxID=101127 RepID=A0A1X2GLY4_9FUNG|nr:hypothetical protein DM01DRAFT_1406328 [Hesseltinella vesiculosa]